MLNIAREFLVMRIRCLYKTLSEYHCSTEEHIEPYLLDKLPSWGNNNSKIKRCGYRAKYKSHKLYYINFQYWILNLLLGHPNLMKLSSRGQHSLCRLSTVTDKVYLTKHNFFFSFNITFGQLPYISSVWLAIHLLIPNVYQLFIKLQQGVKIRLFNPCFFCWNLYVVKLMKIISVNCKIGVNLLCVNISSMNGGFVNECVSVSRTSGACQCNWLNLTGCCSEKQAEK